MNKLLFRLLVVLMSLSLIGIIAVQVYWFNHSLQNNLEQFQYNVKQVISTVAQNLEQQEMMDFIERYNKLRDSIGPDNVSTGFLEFRYAQRDSQTNEMIVYSNSIIAEDFNISPTLFDRKSDSSSIKSFSAKRVTEVYQGGFDQPGRLRKTQPDVRIEKRGTLDILDRAQFEIAFKDVVATYPIQKRISKKKLGEILEKELKIHSINTDFEYAVYSNGLATTVRSTNFKYNKENTYGIPIFRDNEGNSRYQLLVSFPNKRKFLLGELLGITLLSLIFTLIIVVAYSHTLNQLIKQRQISEIKTDFINNMTHEFKTPIATINLALDAIKNPKIIDDKEKVQRYLQMIRDENKRMHAQVENVLRISKLEKKELEINKEPMDVTEIVEDAIDHVNLLLEDKGGELRTHFEAKRTTALINDVHFTNVMVNVLDNAIKYSPENPQIDVYTENVKDFILIKVKDQGQGMSKVAQKRIFEKFYREHTGDLHNVKGHGLGLSYVKRIVEEHNGDIFVESEKGKGSTFIIKIPLIN